VNPSPAGFVDPDSEYFRLGTHFISVAKTQLCHHYINMAIDDI
jgi:hypothetical protein